MRWLFVAPEICTPFSEGRKRFVLDLATQLATQDDCMLLSTRNPQSDTAPAIIGEYIACKTRVGHALSPLTRLPSLLRHFKPDIVCQFPYGTFRGMYWYGATWSMAAVDRLCKTSRLPCITLMYSIDDSTTPHALAGKVSCLAISEHADWDGPVVNVGIKHDNWNIPDIRVHTQQTLLFLAGMWQPTTERLQHVLNTRGLGQLLKAGRYLAPRGVHLIVAAPLLATPELRSLLRTHPDNSWPEEQLEFRDLVRIPDIYREADLLVFPYQEEITQFIPTSVLEAMLANTAVAISDTYCFRHLTNGGKTAYTFPSNNPEQMAFTIMEALDNREARQMLIRLAHSYAVDHWSIDASVRQLRGLADRLIKKQEIRP